jgi:hypothetical protein
VTVARGLALLAILAAIALALATNARANGGQVRVASQPAGPYLVTVFTSPVPLRAGVVDVSVLLQRQGSQEIVEAARIAVVVTTASGEVVSRFPATREQATNKLFYAAEFPLERPGQYWMTVEVDGPEGSGFVRFVATVEPAAGPGWWRAGWVWGALALLLLPLTWWLFRERGDRERVRAARAARMRGRKP